MKTRLFHFPIVFYFIVFYLLGSCQNKVDETKFDNPNFNKSLKKAQFYESIQKYDSAFYYYDKAKTRCTADEVKRKTHVLIKMAEIQKQFCDFSGSEENVTEAFKICDDKAYHPSLYNLLGFIYKETYDYRKSLANYNKVLEYTTKESDRITVLNNIAVVYMEQQQFSKAASILQSLSSKKILDTIPETKARLLDNQGYAYFKLQNSNALPLLERSLRLRDSLKNDYDITASLMHLAEYYLNKNSQHAYDYAFEAYQAASRVNSPDDRLEALDFLIKNAATDEFKKFYTIRSSLNDSIIKVRYKAKNEFANIKYNTRNALQEAKLQKTQKYLYILLLILISSLGVYAFSVVRKKNQQKLKTITYETETRISKRIHDELANDVFNALTFAETQNLQDPTKKETLLENLDTIYSRARNISKENSEIDTGKNYRENLQQMLIQYESTKVNVILQKISSINWDELQPEAKIALYRVLQELMVNMKKHSECSFVTLKFEDHKSHIAIHYSDNGKGIQVLKSKKGLQNAENRIEAIKGSITFDFETEKGFKVSITIPK